MTNCNVQGHLQHLWQHFNRLLDLVPCLWENSLIDPVRCPLCPNVDMDLFDIPQCSSAFSSSPLPHLLSRTLLSPSAYLRLLASMFPSLFLLYLHEYYYKCQVRQNNSTCSKKSVNQCNTSLKLFKMLGRHLPWTRAQSQLYGPVVRAGGLLWNERSIVVLTLKCRVMLAHMTKLAVVHDVCRHDELTLLGSEHLLLDVMTVRSLWECCIWDC